MAAAKGPPLAACVVRVVATAVEAANGDLPLEGRLIWAAAMAIWEAACLEAAPLNLAVAPAGSVDWEASEVVTPALDLEAYSVIPLGLVDKAMNLVAAPYLVVAMEALLLAHLLATIPVFPA